MIFFIVFITHVQGEIAGWGWRNAFTVKWVVSIIVIGILEYIDWVVRMVLSHHFNVEINVNFVVFVGVSIVSNHDVIISFSKVVFFLKTFRRLEDSNLYFSMIRVYDHDVNDYFLFLFVKRQESKNRTSF